MIHQMIFSLPQEYAKEFYYAKGVIGLVGTMTLLWYMNKTWGTFSSLGQRLRFITLLYFAALITAASAEQVRDGIEISLRSIGAMGGGLLLLFTLYISIEEDIINRKK